MRLSQTRIVQRLAIVTIVAGLLAGAIGVFALQSLEQRDLREDAERTGRAGAIRAATIIDGRIEALTAQLQLLAAAEPVSGLTADAQTELEVALRVSGQVDELVLRDAAGNAVAAAASSSLIRASELASTPDLLAELREDPVAALSLEREVPVLELAVRVDDPPGQPVGVLIGRTPLSLLTQLTIDDLLSGGTVFITTTDGTVIASPEGDQLASDDRFPVDLFTDDTRTTTVSGATGPSLASGASLQNVPAWVIVERSEREAVLPAQRYVSGNVLVLIGVILAIMAAAMLTSRQLLRPLGPLMSAVEAIKRGEQGVQTEAGGSGELAELADSFDQMAATLDIRQRDLRTAEQAALSSEERLRLLIEGVEDYAIIQLDDRGAICSWNTGARRIIGYEPDQAIGRSLVSLFDAVSAPTDPLPTAAQTGRAEVEGWCRRESGARFYARISVTALGPSHLPTTTEPTDDGHAPTMSRGYAAILHDMTESEAARRAMEYALRREQQATANLRDASELKDEFLAIAAHEIRTPLSMIIGTSSLLGDGAGLDPEDREELISMLSGQAVDLQQTVERLLDFTQLQAGRVTLSPQQFSLRAELQRQSELVIAQLDGHQLSVEAPDMQVSSDPDALRHVIGNLLSNAAKFSPPSSQIMLRGGIEDGMIVIAVEDRGIGVDPSERRRIFELFRRSADRSITARGTGVGLAIVQRYVELLGGDIQLDSSPGVGSTFIVRVPDLRNAPSSEDANQTVTPRD